MQADPRLLEPFVAVAEERHFGRAAQRLHIAQPALSRRVQQLEREVGVTLLARTTRHVELTDAGRVLLDAARRIVHDTEVAVARARLAAGGELGWLTVGFVDSAAFELLSPLLRRLRERAPDLALELRELSTEQQLADLRDDVAIGIVREIVSEEGLEVSHLLRERLVVAMATTDPRAGATALSLAELADDAFIVFPRPRVPRVHDHLLGVCRAAGFQPRIVTHALQYTTILALVAAGWGIALVPSSARAIAPAGVSLVPLADAQATTDLALARLPAGGSPAAQTFADAALEVAGELPHASG